MRAVFYDTIFFLLKFGILITILGGVCTGVEYQWHFSPPVPPEAVINVTISDNSTTNGTNSTLEGTDNGFTSLEDELASLEAEDTITFINGTWEDVNGTLVWSNMSLPVDTNLRNPKEEKSFRGKKIGKLFLGHVFKEISTTHLPTQCAFECLQHVNCRSYNFNQKNHSCTLNDATHVEHYNSLVENEAFTYYVRDSYHVNKDALGLCMTYPCQNNGYCLDIKTQQGLPSYICICPEGWTGINCDTNADDIDWSEWQAWESCSVTCGTGWKQRRRSCVNKATSEDRSPLDCYGAEVESETCTLLPCPEWDSWSTWSPCSTHDTCGTGIKTRHRSCANRGTPGKDRYCMGPLIEQAPCHEVTCTAPVNLVDGNEYGQGVLQIYNDKSKTWGMVCSEGWGINEATVACRQLGLAGAAEALQNGPTKSYNLPFVLSGLSCLGNETAIQECTHNGWQSSSLCKDGHVVGIKCVVDGGWGDWSSWGECSVTCEDGIRIRTRQCDHPETLRGGQPCDGVAQQEKPCTLPPCPVDGSFSLWSDWGQCSVSCNGGIQWRSRECWGVAHGGADCVGARNQSQECNVHPCPVDGVWRQWSAWDNCSVSCGGGIQWRYRDCDGPYHKGRDCEGSRNESQACNSHPCPIPGDWMEWSPWGECSATCGGGIRYSTRVCDMESYGNLTIDCIGNNTKTGPCHVFSCDPALNCEDWVKRGLTVSTYGPIDPDGPDGFVQPFTVYCNITDERAYTVVGHNNEEPVQVIGYEGAGEYQLALIYGSPGYPPVSALQLAFLVDTSTECKQFISWKCYSATIHHPTSREIVTTFWANRDGEFRYYWGGAPPGSDMCACGVNGTCHKPGTVCNCDANDATWREDAGWITYKPDLPVTDFYAGDTGVQGVEEGYHYLGPLVCSEKDYDTDN